VNPEEGGISLIFPVCNESFMIEQTLRNYIAEFSRVPDLEVIVAEDGSTDDTKVVLERLEGELPIRLFLSDARKGYQQAVLDAVKHATKPWLFIVDSDYQFAAIDLWRLEPYRHDSDIILGIKCPRKDPLYRVWLSWGFNTVLRAVFDVPYRDMDTGFRLMRRTVVEDIAPQISQLSTFTAEFVVRAHWAGYRVREVPVYHYARKISSTTIYFMSNLVPMCLYQFLGILRLRREFARRGLRNLGSSAPIEREGSKGPG
jgi:glycosyltransferase involved in cell wall biosynthesis